MEEYAKDGMKENQKNKEGERKKKKIRKRG